MNNSNKFISIVFLMILFLLVVFLFGIHNKDITKFYGKDSKYNSMYFKTIEKEFNKNIYDLLIKDSNFIKQIDSVVKYILSRHVYNHISTVIEEHNFNAEKFIKWACVDINTPFFNIEGDSFFVQRDDIWFPREEVKKYSVSKDENKKRIFILGESIARLYPEDMLEKELSKYFNNVDVINVGMGSYDSYRIEKISKEMVQFKPDYVVLIIGNNDGSSECYFGMRINSIIERTFQKNIIKIIENLKDTNIIFYDSPYNEFFSPIDIIENIKRNCSKERYNKNLWKNSSKYLQLTERIDFLKQASEKYNNVYITNLTDILRDYTGDKLGYNVFFDDSHFENATYLLLSKIITKMIMEKEKGLDVNLDLSKQEYNKALISDIEKFVDIQNLQKLSRFLSGNYSAIYNKIDTLYKGNKEIFYNEYKIANEEFLKNNTNTNYKILIFYADVLQNNGKIEEAEKILNDLIKLAPNNFEAYLIMGYMEYKNNNFEAADKYFAKVKELNENSDINVAYLKLLK